MTQPFKEPTTYHGAVIEYIDQEKNMKEGDKVCLIRIPDYWQRGIDYDI